LIGHKQTVGWNEGEILMHLRRREMSRTFLLWCWIPAQFAISAACLVLAARSYPHYSMFDHDISFLGHPRLNPAGWLYWSAGMGLSGIMLWPITVHISRSMRALTAGQSPRRRRLVAAGTFASRSACFGLIGLGLIPQFPGLDPAHELAGVLAMGGLYVALWIFAGILVCRPPISLAKALLFVVALGWGPVGYLATQGWRFFVYGELGHDVNVSPQYLLLRFSLWEWLLFFCLFPALFLVVLGLPDARSEPKAAHPSVDSENAAGAAL
jgi:hypothetical protein